MSIPNDPKIAKLFFRFLKRVERAQILGEPDLNLDDGHLHLQWFLVQGSRRVGRIVAVYNNRHHPVHGPRTSWIFVALEGARAPGCIHTFAGARGRGWWSIVAEPAQITESNFFGLEGTDQVADRFAYAATKLPRIATAIEEITAQRKS